MTELQTLAKLTDVQAELTEVRAELKTMQAEQKVFAERLTARETEVKSYTEVKQMKVKYYWCKDSDPIVNEPTKITAFVIDEPSSLTELKKALYYICAARLCWKDSEGDIIDVIDAKGMKLAFDECRKIGVLKMYGQAQ